ncbi:MAG: hypothetical protein KBG15_17800 [Kofleriaceae bacterium]|nr:hypothetical protein [Kofleriaceae bacterium]
MNRRIAQTIVISLGVVCSVVPGFAGTSTLLNLSGDSGNVPVNVAAPTAMAASTQPKSKPEVNVALTVNLPLMWGLSIGVSAIVAVAKQHAVRFNGARYDKFFLTWFMSDDGPPTGRNYDGSVSWIYYPRRVFTGATVEVGALYRDRTEAYYYDMGRDENYDIASRILASQAFVGWNWRVGGTFYVAAAVGASVGLENGTHTFRDINGKYVTEDVAEIHTGAEGYLRFGAVFK